MTRKNSEKIFSCPAFSCWQNLEHEDAGQENINSSQTMIVEQSNLVSENPMNRSLKHARSSRRKRIATSSPSFSDSVASERQCTPAMLRPMAMFDASLFNSPPTVSGGPV